MKFQAQLQSKRLEPELLTPRKYQSDCTICLNVSGSSFSDAIASLSYEGLILATQLDKFHMFCNTAKGRNWDQWDRILAECQIHAPGFNFANIPTTDGHLFKAALLIYPWCESAIISIDPAILDKLLVDEFVLDYTGSIGVQQHIYFLPKELLKSENQAACERLYKLTLLSRIFVTFEDKTIHTYFTPLHTFAVDRHLFDSGVQQGGPTYLYWAAIQARMARKIRMYVEGQKNV
jgi:hypothetical protein